MITANQDETTGELSYDYSRLHSALIQTRNNLAQTRKRRYEAVATYLAPYGLSSDEGTVANRLFGQTRIFKLTTAVQTYQRLLAARRPKVFCRTWDQEGVSAAALLESAVNLQFEAMGIEDTFRQSVLEAMFSAGIAKTGMDKDGQVFCEIVDFDDVVFDCAANNIHKMRFIGNYYRMPRSEAKEIIGDKATGSTFQNIEMGESYDVKKLTTSLPPETLEEEVEFLDVFLVRERLLVTFLAASRQGGFTEVKTVPFVGPEEGPYDMLKFGETLKSVIPMAPALMWREMSEAIDQITSKLVRQARRQKEVVAGNGEVKDLQRLSKASDSDWLSVAGNVNDAVKAFSFGGPHQGNFAFVLSAMEMFNGQSGNLNVLAGLGSEADTARQEDLLNKNAGGMVDEMRDRVHAFAGCIAYKIAWYIWHSDMVIPIDITSPNGLATVTHLWTRDQRVQSWDQFRFSIEPYSMVPQTPQSVRDQVNELVGNVIAPLSGQLMQQGYMIDAAEIVKLNAKLSNLPEINRIIKMNPAVAMMAQQQGESPQVQTKPPPREYIRTSQSKTSPEAKNAAIRAQAAGQTQQPKQQAQGAA